MVTKLQDHLQRSNLLPPKANLVVAVSGGVDSVALLDLLNQLQPIWNWQLSVAHLDHKMRPDSAASAELASQLAAKYDLPFYLGQLDGSGGSEAALRKKRYEFLDSVADGAQADYIVTAHHLDDRIETSIFNTIRGADREGMTAMKPLRGKILRPLLPFSKGQLATYAAIKELPFHEDSSNADVGYSRNFVRQVILPHATELMPDFRPEYTERLDRLETLTAKIQVGLEQVLEIIKASERPGRIVLRRQAFLKLSPIIQLNLLAFISRKLNAGVGLTSKNLDESLKFLFSAGTGVESLALPGLKLERRYDTFIITRAPVAGNIKQAPPSTILSPGGVVTVSDLVLACRDDFMPTEKEYIFIKPMSVYVRSWQPGDRVKPVGMNGSKKLQDIFVDKKVPRPLRSIWPVVVTGDNEIIWLPALVRDRRFVESSRAGNYQLICEVA